MEALATAASRGDRQALTALTLTLDAMAAGGIYDHLGGGFARYAVDGVWLVPHFEKMLYDNALLIRLYLHGWQLTGEERFRQVLGRDHRVRAPRPPPARRWHLVGRGRRQRGRGGQVLRVDRHAGAGGARRAAPTSLATGTGSGPAATSSTARPSRTACTPAASWRARQRWRRPAQALFEARAARVRPGLDDKVLTEWNAYLVAALAEAGAATGETAWVDAAVETAEFLLANLRRADGRWLRAWQADAGARHLAYATDHGALVDAFTRLAEATGQARWIAEARGRRRRAARPLLGRRSTAACSPPATTPRR